MNFQLRASAVNRDRIQFGYNNGIVQFSSKPSFSTELLPSVVISRIETHLEDTTHILHFPVSCRHRYVIDQSANKIIIYFNVPGVPYFKSMNYRYKLEGIDNEWIPFTGSDNVSFQQIPAGGTRTFVLQLMDQTGIVVQSQTSVLLVTERDPAKILQIVTFVLVLGMMLGVILIMKKGAIRKRTSRSVTTTSAKEDFIAELNDFILTNIENDQLSSADIERKFGLSRTKLFRQLKDKSGMSVTAYIRDIRLQKAREILETGNYTVSEVIHKVGFNSRSYFYKCYREKFGRGPRE
jgi:AraC-like DNA-binding protein